MDLIGDGSVLVQKAPVPFQGSRGRRSRRQLPTGREMRGGDDSGDADADGWGVPVPPDNSVMGDVERKSVLRWRKVLEAWVKVQRRSTCFLLSFAVFLYAMIGRGGA